MRRGARVVGALGALATAAAAQSPTVDVAGPSGNPLRIAAPQFTLRALNFAPEDFPIQFRLQVATSEEFSGTLLADTLVAGPEATVTIPRVLPAGAVVYWRAVALTARSGSFPSVITGPRTVGPHLTLVSPNNPAGQSIATRRPVFTWRSSAVPVGLRGWDFELRVESAPYIQPVVIARTEDTTFTLTQDLEANTSYRWQVIARFPASGETIQVTSLSSFVIRSADAPLATLLYQNFPNPFPSTTSDQTCFWFDLAVGGPVSLEILDLRGHPVRRLVPNARVPATLPPGRYGRPAAGATSGCDPAFTWDARSDAGRRVPPGVYLVRFRTPGTQDVRRVVVSGR